MEVKNPGVQEFKAAAKNVINSRFTGFYEI